MYSWGKASDGQLGLGGIQENIITSPRWNKHVAERSIRQVACGTKHTLLLTEAGTVHSCGSNEKGQLGQDETSTRPAPIINLESRKIIHVCCGYVHSVALDDQGQLFSWGGNKYGQVGNEHDKSEINFVPKVVPTFSGKRVLQIACGANHILALVEDGWLYSWGDNSDCQLGHNRDKLVVGTPTVVQSLAGLPIVKLAAGKAHNLVLSGGGGVFSWGRNTFGQLGYPPKAGLHSPVEVKDLKKKKVKFISCGEEHTAVLTEDGSVFTFGSNSYGQLGHNNTQNVSTPTKVEALSGREVCQVACGRMHTLVLVKDTCEQLSFGLGANGQLGGGQTSNSLQPAPIKGDNWTAPVISEATGTLSDAQLTEGSSVDCRILKGIFAGGDQSFATIAIQPAIHPDTHQDTTESMDIDSGSPIPIPPPTPTTPTCSSSTSSPLRDDRIVHLSRLPHYITGEIISEWLDKSSKKYSMEEVVRILSIVFSNPSCLNASFLHPMSKHPTAVELSGVDLVSIMESFKLIHEKIILPEKAKTSEDPVRTLVKNFKLASIVHGVNL